MSNYTKITVNERCTIEADEHNWTVHYHPQKLELIESAGKDGRARYRYNGRSKFLNSLPAALDTFAELELKHQGEKTNLFDLIKQVKSLRNEISGLLRDQVAI
jgi:hypothetical protein